jgi:hypothetical protein
MSAAFSSVGSKVFAVLGSALLLAACSNNDDDDSPDTGQVEQPPPPPPTAGTLIENPPPRIASLPITDLINLVNVNSTAGRVLDFIVDPECGVDVHQLRYNTQDPAR